jgi:hypothetical protein
VQFVIAKQQHYSAEKLESYIDWCGANMWYLCIISRDDVHSQLRLKRTGKVSAPDVKQVRFHVRGVFL